MLRHGHENHFYLTRPFIFKVLWLIDYNKVSYVHFFKNKLFFKGSLNYVNERILFIKCHFQY